MTAASAGEFLRRQGQPVSPERVAEWVRFSPDAHRAGLCDGLVTFALDQSANNPFFEAIRRESSTFGKAR